MNYGRLRTLLILLGWVLLIRPVQGEESKLDEQQKQKLLAEAQQFNEQAEKLRRDGQFSQAIPPSEKALEIRKKVLNPGHLDIASSQFNLGRLYLLMGQLAKVEPFFQDALAIRKKSLGPEHPDIAWSMLSLAVLYRQQGQFTKAEPLFKDVLTIRKKALGPRHPDVANSLYNLAEFYVDMGQYDKVESLHHEALVIRKEILGPRHSETASSMTTLARFYTDMKQFAKAEPLYQEALLIYRETQGPRHPDVASVLNELAILYGAIGQYTKAELLAQEALAVCKDAMGPRHREVALTMETLGNLYRETDQYAKAEALFQEALAILKETLGARHWEVAQSLSYLADLDQRTGQYTKAETLQQESLAITMEVLGPRHPLTASALVNLAALYVDMGLYTKAEPLYQKALVILIEAKGPRNPDVAEFLHGQALLHLAMDRPEVALPMLKQSLDISEQLLRTFLTESRLASLLQKLRARDEDVYSLLAQNQGVAAVRQLALAVALLRKGRSAEEGLLTQHAIQQALTEPQDRLLFERLTAAHSQLANLYLRGAGSVPDYRKTITALESEADGLELKLAQHSKAFHSVQFPGPDDVVAQVAQALPKDAALVEVLAFKPRRFSAKGRAPKWGDPRYMALILFPDQEIRVVDLGEVGPIDQTIAALQEQLSNRRPDYLATAQKLHSLVVAPLHPALAGRTNLLVSPDGALNLVPLWALHDGKQFMVDAYRITYLTSGRDLLRPPTTDPQSLSITVLANPDFRTASAQGAHAVALASASRAAFLQQLEHVPPLPGTGAEALTIQRMFPQARLLLGSEATEKVLRSLQAPAVLHIATHGVFWDDHSVPQYDAAYQPGRTLKVVAAPSVPGKAGSNPVNPMARSALLLAGVEALGQQGQDPPNDNDGLMTALEVSGLSLWGTQLVVLSACDTGRGAVQLGQGVYGLRRAFFNAGAETLVTSLWPVSDEATRGLMGGYYRNLLARQGRVEAMRQAALAVRAKQPHPYYWAPFVVLGKGEPLHGIPANH